MKVKTDLKAGDWRQCLKDCDSITSNIRRARCKDTCLLESRWGLIP